MFNFYGDDCRLYMCFIDRENSSRVVEEVNFRQFIRTLALFHNKNRDEPTICNEKRIECKYNEK